MTRILFVEDDRPLARGVVSLLRDSGHAVDHVEHGADALSLAAEEPYGVVILDIGLPDVSGFEILRSLRTRGSKVPVLMLTARDALQDRVAGLDMGADDYLLKPFDPPELEARVRALTRRNHGDPSPRLSVGRLTLDTSSGEVRIGDRLVELRRREMAVLTSLVSRPGKVIGKERLASEVFSFDDEVSPNALELYVARLRKKLEPDGPRIRTLRGVGYVIEAR